MNVKRSLRIGPYPLAARLIWFLFIAALFQNDIALVRLCVRNVTSCCNTATAR